MGAVSGSMSLELGVELKGMCSHIHDPLEIDVLLLNVYCMTEAGA